MNYSTAVLAADHLSAVRGRHTLFAGLDFVLPSGRALLLRGYNGSGKTTLLRMLAGLTTPAYGRVLWKGRPIDEQRAAYNAELLYLGHLAAVSEMMSVRENLEAWVELDSGTEPGPELDAALDRVGLKTRRNLQARMLSQGQRRRIGLARLLLAGRSIWLLDEPTTALDAAGIEMLGQALDRHLRRGGTAVVATHQQVPVDGALATEIALG